MGAGHLARRSTRLPRLALRLLPFPVTPPLSSTNNGRCVDGRIPDEADRHGEEKDDGRTRPRASAQEKEKEGHCRRAQQETEQFVDTGDGIRPVRKYTRKGERGPVT